MDYVLKLHTLSLRPGAAIVAIGLSKFNLNGPVDQEIESTEFWAAMSSCTGTVDPATVEFWLKNHQLQEAYAQATKTSESWMIDAALRWMNFSRGDTLWGRVSMDQMILTSRLGNKAPWEFFQLADTSSALLVRPIKFANPGVSPEAIARAAASVLLKAKHNG